MNPTENPSPVSSSAPQGVKPHRLIKLGVDVHLREWVSAARRAPQPMTELIKLRDKCIA